MMWVNCIRDNCPESKNGKCVRGYYGFGEEKHDFPVDGKCLYPFEAEYDSEIAALGAYDSKCEICGNSDELDKGVCPYCKQQAMEELYRGAA